MDLPGLNPRPGKVIEAEILRKFGASVCVHPSSPRSQGFLLVVSFGRCKYRLNEAFVALILQATIGGSAPLFRVQLLNDRVFRFMVCSQAVGFHIYKLSSFECSNYKLFFNLWHGGGPNFIQEYKLWQLEEQASWTTVGAKAPSSSSPVCPPLTGANSVPITVSKSMKHSKFESPVLEDRNSNRQRPTQNGVHGLASYNLAGILGPIPFSNRVFPGFKVPKACCSNCLSLAHLRPACNNIARCRQCLHAGHNSRMCKSLPIFSRVQQQIAALNLDDHSTPKSLHGGPKNQHRPRSFQSMIDFLNIKRRFGSALSGHSPLETVLETPSSGL